MKIIDKETGKRLKKSDPIQRNAVKELENPENSPMDPPSAYADSNVPKVKYNDFVEQIKTLIDEHRYAEKFINRFERAMATFKDNGYQLDKEINQAFSEFYKFFDDYILPHNRKEESGLFNILRKKLIESGEHGTGDDQRTAIDIMEDDHVKFIQLATLSFNMLGLAPRLQDGRSQAFVYDVACQNARELVELLRLHIFREDNTLFPLAQKLISNEEFERLEP